MICGLWLKICLKISLKISGLKIHLIGSRKEVPSPTLVLLSLRGKRVRGLLWSHAHLGRRVPLQVLIPTLSIIVIIISIIIIIMTSISQISIFGIKSFRNIFTVNTLCRHHSLPLIVGNRREV